MNSDYGTENIHFEEFGDGNPLILLHGYTESVKIWYEFAQQLMAKFRVVLIDLPGHGKSPCIDDVHSMELMADTVKFVANRLGITSAVVIGHSMGGYVALALARKYNNMIKGLGLFHSTSLADTDEVKSGRERAIEAIQGNHGAFLAGFIPGLFAEQNRGKYQAEIQKLIEDASLMDQRALIAAQKGMKLRSSTLDVLINATFPVMFIAGQKDLRIPFENVWVQMALTEKSYSLILREVGHMGYIEAKTQTLDFVQSFGAACFR